MTAERSAKLLAMVESFEKSIGLERSITTNYIPTQQPVMPGEIPHPPQSQRKTTYSILIDPQKR